MLNISEHLYKSYNVMVLGIVYLIFGLTSSYFINKFSSKASPEDSKVRLMIEIAAETAITILFSYFIDLIVEKMPLPMIGSEEMKRQIIQEVRGGIIIAFAMFTLQVKLRSKIEYLFYGHITDYQPVAMEG